MYKNKFNYKQISMIGGWLSFIDFELMKTIIDKQNEFIKGSLVEIDVHHGKSLNLWQNFQNKMICMLLTYLMNKKNISFSGKGDRDIFLNNLKKFLKK